MSKTSIIERIAAERKKKRLKMLRAKRKMELETRIKSNDKKTPNKDMVADQDLLESIKKELKSKGIKDTQEPVATTIGDLSDLVERGTKESWLQYFANNLKTETKMEFPPIDLPKCKFSDYGYRRLIELIIESDKFLKYIIEIKDVSGFQVVELNHLIRGDDPTLRGIEALCNLIINNEIRYNPVCETDFKYLNVLLDSFTLPKKDGVSNIWGIEIGGWIYQITARFDKSTTEWIYSFSKNQT